jgi:hypothetical protein
MGTNSHSLLPNDLRLAIFLAALMILGDMRSGYVFAQAGNADETSWKEDTVDDAQRRSQGAIVTILLAKEGKFTGQSQQNDFDKYYQTYALPRWTQIKNLGSLSVYRKELVSRDLSQAKSQVHDHLNDLVLEYMEKLIKPNSGYHPSVCYNAMLAIGSLNSVEGTPPTPLDRAMPILLVAVNDPMQSEPMKIAALIGINRHVSLGVNNQQTQNQILALMIKLAGADMAETPDPGREWMRKQAVEILGLLGNAGGNNQVIKTLSKIIGDAKISLYTRCAAAESFGKLKFTGASAVNAAETGKNLGQLMFDACDAELKIAKAGEMPISRRRLRTILIAAIDALKNLTSQANNAAQKTSLANLQKIFVDLDKAMDKDFSRLDPAALQAANDELKKAVETCRDNLDEWLKK